MPEMCGGEQEVSSSGLFRTSEVAVRPLYLKRPEIKVPSVHLLEVPSRPRFHLEGLLSLPCNSHKSRTACTRRVSLGMSGGIESSSPDSRTHFLPQFPFEHISSQLCLKLHPDPQPPDSFIHLYLSAIPRGPSSAAGALLMTQAQITDVACCLTLSLAHTRGQTCETRLWSPCRQDGLDHRGCHDG